MFYHAVLLAVLLRGAIREIAHHATALAMMVIALRGSTPGDRPALLRTLAGCLPRKP